MAFKSAWVSKQDAGDAKMQELAGYIADGAMAFLKAEWRVLSIFVLFTAALLAYSGTIHEVNGRADPLELGDRDRIYHRSRFLRDRRIYRHEGRDQGKRPHHTSRPHEPETGTESVLHRRNGHGPRRCRSWRFWASAVCSSRFSPLFAGLGANQVKTAIEVLTGFSLGAESIALFARVGGGIYTKAADVGADLVGKVEAGIPEDDVRNPATIADNVGDNVGDVAGMGADLFGSYVATILATMVLGQEIKVTDAFGGMSPILLPMVICGLGIVFSIIGTVFVTDQGRKIERSKRSEHRQLGIDAADGDRVILCRDVDAAGRPDHLAYELLSQKMAFLRRSSSAPSSARS